MLPISSLSKFLLSISPIVNIFIGQPTYTSYMGIHNEAKGKYHTCPISWLWLPWSCFLLVMFVCLVGSLAWANQSMYSDLNSFIYLNVYQAIFIANIAGHIYDLFVPDCQWTNCIQVNPIIPIISGTVSSHMHAH